MKNVTEQLRQGKILATKEMIPNNDFIFLKGNKVVRSWEGDKYTSIEPQEWIEVGIIELKADHNET